MIVQIYEIQTPCEAERCIELGVDHIGSVLLAKDTWRNSTLKETILLSERAGARSCLIPLFREPHTLYRVVDYYRPHYIHFCDSLLDPRGQKMDLQSFIGLQRELKGRFPHVRIMRSIPIPRKGVTASFSPLETARELESFSDVFLTDTWLGKEPVEGYIGITGKTADWDLARQLVEQSRIPVILAGGLSPENVYDAVSKILPAGADSCTWTNEQDILGRPLRFQKDFRRVEKFVKEVRRAEKERIETTTRDETPIGSALPENLPDRPISR